MDVKICGITRREDAEAAAAAGAGYLGFVMAESPRRVDASRVEALASDLPVVRVGVFVDRAPTGVLRAAESAALGVVQLHGDEPPEACRRLRSQGLEVWKAVRPRSSDDLRAASEAYRDVADALLVEGYSDEGAGGVGAGFPHEWLGVLERDDEGPRIVLAGGLTPETVADAVRRVGPDVVDVSSGVERRPGIKDPGLVRAFVEAARSAAGDPVGSAAGPEDA